MIISLLAGAIALLFCLPSCTQTMRVKRRGLFERIEREQDDRFRQAFRSQPRQWPLPGVGWIRQSIRLTETWARWLGVERQKTAASLQRLRWEVSVEEVVAAKLIGACLLVLAVGWVLLAKGAAEPAGTARWLPVLAAGAVFLLPTKWIEWADERAKEEIRRQIPVFFGIVQVLVESGMPVHTAMREAAKRFEGRLGTEIARLETEQKQFGNWRKALEEMAFRWDVDALVAIVAEIANALTKGTSIARSLAVQVEEQLRQQEDEASAYVNRLTVRLLPLLIVFMGVPLLFLILGPSFLGIKQRL